MAKVTFDEVVRRTVEVPRMTRGWTPTEFLNWIGANLDNLRVYSEETRGMELIDVGESARFEVRNFSNIYGGLSEYVGIYDNDTETFILERHVRKIQMVEDFVKELNHVD